MKWPACFLACVCFVWLCVSSAYGVANRFEALVRIEHHPAVDFQGIETYTLHLGKGLAVTVLVDDDLPLATVLSGLRGGRARLTLEGIADDAPRLER